MYRLAVTCCGGDLVTVPAKNYGADLTGMLAAVTDATRLIFIANPNNPTGTRTPGSELLPFLQAVPEHVWVVLDEAYLEYVEDEDHINGATLLARFPNLIVTRTFSKVYGLAAVRFGYGVSSPAFADLLNRARQPFNVNSLALAASLAALEDDDYVNESVALNRAGMAQVTEGLTRLGYDFIPSAGNFVAFDSAEPGNDLFQRMLREGRNRASDCRIRLAQSCTGQYWARIRKRAFSFRTSQGWRSRPVQIVQQRRVLIVRPGILAIVGVGLIGGSIGKAAKERRLAERVIGVEPNADSAQWAVENGVLDAVVSQVPDNADLIALCVPSDLVAQWVIKLADHTAPMFDVGSVKEPIVKEIELTRITPSQFVPCHPISGSEKVVLRLPMAIYSMGARWC